MALPPDLEIDEESLELLAQVELRSFTAEPQRILPFAASRLRWQVSAPQGVGIRFEINSTSVQANGERLVTPARTHTFTLKAKRGRHARVLGRVTVEVDLAACRTDELTGLDETLSNLLTNAIETDPDLYFRMMVSSTGPFGEPPRRSVPILSFTTSTIGVKLMLKATVESNWLGIDWAPDPSVDIKVKFGLDVVNGDIIAVNSEINADVSVPWYTWLIPGAMIGLPIALSGGRERARAGAQELIDGIIQALNFLVFVGEGRRLHSVAISTNGTDADLMLTHCPQDVLLGLIQREVIE